MSLNKEPEMGKNFWIAMILSMLIILGYPTFLKWMNPDGFQEPSATEETTLEEPIVESPAAATVAEENLEKRVFKSPEPPKTIRVETDLYELELSTLGATIPRFIYHGKELHTDLDTGILYEGSENLPGILGVDILHERTLLTQQIFKLAERSSTNDFFKFQYEKSGEYRVTKSFYLDPSRPVIRMGVKIENLSTRTQNFPLVFHYGLDINSADQMAAHANEAVLLTHKVEYANHKKLMKKGFSVSDKILWAGAVKKYFAVLLKPDWNAVGFEANADDEKIKGALKMEPFTIRGGESISREVLVYAGPQIHKNLKEFDAGFESILSKGFFGLFKLWLLLALNFLNGITHNYGIAIILLTILIKILFWPLTQTSFKSMKKMQVIQPKIKSLQERHKENPEKLNKAMIDLFKRNKVNPMMGCLPMLVQMPILFAMFRLLPEAIELNGAPFFGWINDLSQPDRLFMLPFTVPFLGWDSVNLLPILMVASQWFYQKTMPQPSASPEQAKIMSLMPLLFGFICYNMASGLVLYWFIQNILSVVQQYFTNRISIVLHHEDQD